MEIINKQWALHRENKEQERKAKVRNWVVKVFLWSIVVDMSWYLSFKICIVKMNVKIKLLSNFSLKIKGEEGYKVIRIFRNKDCYAFQFTFNVFSFCLSCSLFLFTYSHIFEWFCFSCEHHNIGSWFQGWLTLQRILFLYVFFPLIPLHH